MGAGTKQATIWANADQVLCPHMASPGHNELMVYTWPSVSYWWQASIELPQGPTWHKRNGFYSSLFSHFSFTRIASSSFFRYPTSSSIGYAHGQIKTMKHIRVLVSTTCFAKPPLALERRRWVIISNTKALTGLFKNARVKGNSALVAVNQRQLNSIKLWQTQTCYISFILIHYFISIVKLSLV